MGNTSWYSRPIPLRPQWETPKCGMWECQGIIIIIMMMTHHHPPVEHGTTTLKGKEDKNGQSDPVDELYDLIMT